MRCGILLLLLNCGTLIAQAPATNEPTIQDLIKSVKELTEKLSDEVSEYLLQAEISKLKAKLVSENDLENPDANAVINSANEALRKRATGKVAEIIKNTRPLTAVLFSSQDRNSYEVIKDPQDASKGIINQDQSGDTGGILIAAEAPFYFPYYGNRTVTPVGAWFGVRMQTGGGADVSGVDLAAGLSISYISGTRVTTQSAASLNATDGARLLFGVLYGEVATLGAGLTEGSAYPLGEQVPLKKEKDISFTMGLGFRF